ncbi:MAG: 1-acyl-sn-glycerol-3-phosphate acyltransferase [bacterium]|nr:1-acyl-sn-glycerol-3-phosphate acyltransferase [bacterium]
MILIKPFIYLVLGVNISGIKNLPKLDNQPAILVANHNSHIDTLILMSLFTCSQILKIHPLAAIDYFCKNKIFEFIFKTLIGIVPIKRKVTKSSATNMYSEVNKILQKNETIIIYPEGSRGNSSDIQSFKSGVAHIAQMNPNVPVIPIYINGPDRILPKGTLLWIPFIANVYVAEPIYYDNTSTKMFTEKIRSIVEQLKEEHRIKEEL